MLITFEGIDASGKTTQIGLLAKSLKAQGCDVLVTRQPGGTMIGGEIRRLLLDPRHRGMVAETEVLLYMADRIQHLQEIILPALHQKKTVLCDRYHDATLAYQGGGRQLDLDWLSPLTEKQLVIPTLTLWFDISVTVSIARLKARNTANAVENCRLESENEGFFDRVRQVYLTLHRKDPKRFIRIDGEKSIESIHDAVVEIVQNRLH
jgi:dTMP kinase